jgi:CRISPR/Cas system-associated exonuclease Cas4 (RecB family)
MASFSKGVLKWAPWSVSKAETALKCPLKFHLQYNDKPRLGIAETVVLDDTALRIGSAAHGYAEGVAKGKPASMVLRQVTRKNKLTSTEQESLSYLIPGVEQFLARVRAFKTKNGIDQDLIEADLAINAEGEPTGYWDDDALFRWKVDRQLVSASGESVAVLDLKTGNSASLKWAQDQLDAYAYGAFCLYPEAKKVRCGLYSAKDEEFIWAELYRRETAANSNTPAFLEEAAKATESREPSTGRHCDWCKYQKICPAKK